MMADCSAVVKVLLVLTCFHLSSADTHTLQYLYTALTPGTITTVGLLDGEQFVYCDNKPTVIIKANWIIEAAANDSEYWRRETDHMKNQEDELHDVAKVMLNNVKQTEGNHTLQRRCGCELYNDGTTRGYNQFGYNGEDFISLDLKTGTWTAANDEAEDIIKQWEAVGDRAKHWTDFLKSDCIDWLKTFVSYSRETQERKVRPEVSVLQKHSSSPEVVCHATGFFPKALMITWQKDGEDVHEDVELRETLPNQDGSFQKRSILKVPAEELQKHTYTCVIQHSSLEKELVLPVSERRILRGGGSAGGSVRRSAGGRNGVLMGVVVAGVVALIGLIIIIVAGIRCWKNNNSGSRSTPDRSVRWRPVSQREDQEV